MRLHNVYDAHSRRYEVLAHNYLSKVEFRLDEVSESRKKDSFKTEVSNCFGLFF